MLKEYPRVAEQNFKGITEIVFKKKCSRENQRKTIEIIEWNRTKIAERISQAIAEKIPQKVRFLQGFYREISFQSKCLKNYLIDSRRIGEIVSKRVCKGFPK